MSVREDVYTPIQAELKRMRRYMYPEMSKDLGEFHLGVEGGQFTDSEIIVMLGENGTGKTTFIRLMAGLLKPESGGIYTRGACVCVELFIFCSGGATDERQL